MLAPARLLALLAPLLLMAGALGSQFIGHLYPCEMCHWQRWPHYAAIVAALLALLLRGNPPASRALTILAGLLILTSGLIGFFHAGVEYHWWEGPTKCTSTAAAGPDLLRSILQAPLIRCDQPQWTLWHVSLAGWNFLFSTAAGLAVLVLCLKRPR